MPPLWNPTNGWRPASSFAAPVPVPGVEPDADPQVQLCFSRSWLPYVVGSLMQLTQPTTWDTTDSTTLQTALSQATALQEMFGAAGACEVLSMRISDCALQFSVDGGDTWTTVTDWSSFGQDCLPIPAPPNPLGTAHDQNACNIATYLATQLIQGALVSVVDSYNHTLTDVAAVAAIISLIPGWGTALSAGIDAGAGLYILVTAGTISAFTTASTSSTLLKSLQCAIYGAIVSSGQVTAGNFAAIQTAIHAIGYTSTPVQNAIDAYVTALGVNGFMQAQLVGGVYVGDCSDCGAPWCWTIDFTTTAGGSTQYSPTSRGSTIYNIRTALIGWHSNGYNIGADGVAEAGFQLNFSAAHVTTVEMVYTANVTSGGNARILFAQNPPEVTTIASLTLSASAIGGDQTVTLTVNATTTSVGAAIRTNQNTDVQAIRSITIRGTGVSPFGSSNCTP